MTVFMSRLALYIWNINVNNKWFVKILIFIYYVMEFSFPFFLKQFLNVTGEQARIQTTATFALANLWNFEEIYFFPVSAPRWVIFTIQTLKLKKHMIHSRNFDVFLHLSSIFTNVAYRYVNIQFSYRVGPLVWY